VRKKTKDGLLTGYLRKARFRQAIPFIKGKTVLDIGCDKGQIIPFLPSETRYIGIDSDRQSIEMAKKTYPNIEFLNQEITCDCLQKLNLENVDTILLLAVIEHMEKPFQIIERLGLILKRGGHMIITSPLKQSHGILTMLSWIRILRNDKHEHISYIDHGTILDFSKVTRFRVKEYRKFQLGLNQLWVLERMR